MTTRGDPSTFFDVEVILEKIRNALTTRQKTNNNAQKTLEKFQAALACSLKDLRNIRK